MLPLKINRSQRIALLGAAVVIALIQLYAFNKNGVRGSGWVFSLITITILFFLVLSNEKDADRIRKVASSSKEPDAAVRSRVTANMEAINALTEEISKELFGRFKDIEAVARTLPPISKVVRSSLLLYSFSLLLITKLRHDPSFLTTEEFQKTKGVTIMQCVAADSQVIAQASATPNEKMLSSFLAEAILLEESVRDFANQLALVNTKTPAMKINEWLMKRTGISDFGGKSPEDFTKDNLRSLYNKLYELPV